MPNKQNIRLEQLTFTRFLAAISIVVFHYGKNIFPFSFDSVDFLFRQANIGVSYFFILSGFVMIIAYSKKAKVDFGDFLKRRFARIYPVYFLAIIVYLMYYLALGRPVDYQGMVLNIALIQSWIPGFALSFNGPGWSLVVEMFFYISFPFLFNYFYKKYPPQKLYIPIILVFIISQALSHILMLSSFYQGFPSESHDFVHYFPLLHLNEFLVGNLTGMIFLKGLKQRNYDLPIIALIFTVIFLLQSNSGIFFHNGILAIIFVPIILMISANNGLLTKISNAKSLVFLGEISYGLYILQQPIYTWLNGILKFMGISNPTVIFYTSFVVLILFSALSYKFFEVPLRRFINRTSFGFWRRSNAKSGKTPSN